MSIPCIASASFAGLMRTSQKPNGGLATMSSVRHLDLTTANVQSKSCDHVQKTEFLAAETPVFLSSKTSSFQWSIWKDSKDLNANTCTTKRLSHNNQHFVGRISVDCQTICVWSMWITKKQFETFSVSVSVSSIQMYPVLLPRNTRPENRGCNPLTRTYTSLNWNHNDSHWLQVL